MSIAVDAMPSSRPRPRYLRGPDVLKVFDNMFFKNLLHLTPPVRRCRSLVAAITGDSTSATTTEFLDSIG